MIALQIETEGDNVVIDTRQKGTKYSTQGGLSSSNRRCFRASTGYVETIDFANPSFISVITVFGSLQQDERRNK